MFHVPSDLDELPSTTPVRPKARGKKKPKEVVRPTQWSMTVQELCDISKISHLKFLEWVAEGVLGNVQIGKVRSPHSTLTRAIAQRTILVTRLVAAGIHPIAAGHIASAHLTNDKTPLETELTGGVTVIIDRFDLP